MNLTALCGLLLMVVSEAGTLARIEPFWSWNTPIAWTGFILFADGVVWRARGHSWIRSAPQEFALLSAVSVPLWLVFELYNRFIANWHYTGLPDNSSLRVFGYAWAFSTIWPAIFEGADLVAVWSGSVGARARGSLQPEAPGVGPRREEKCGAPRAVVNVSGAVSIVFGAVMLIAPFVVPPAAARYLAAPVWLGFIFLLDPINARLGEASLVSDLHAGRYDRMKNLALSGALCGFLWEFWNYWSRAKWHYTVPIMEHTKIFEMPLPGYFGFPAFALECFTMYIFVRALLIRLTPAPASAFRQTIAL